MGKGRAALSQGAPTGWPGDGARRAWAKAVRLLAAASPGLTRCGVGVAVAPLLRLSPDFEVPRVSRALELRRGPGAGLVRRSAGRPLGPHARSSSRGLPG